MAGILDEFLLLFKPVVQGTGFKTLNKQIKDTTESLFSVKNLFRAFVGYDIYSGIKQFTGSMINATREMGAMRSRFYAITGDENKANQQLQWAFKLAERTAMPMKSLADSYSIFYAATQKGLGDSGAQQVFQDWTEVSRVLHMSEYQFERVTYALREMASKGVVYSQDLRMQIGTHVPNAIGLAEKAVNDLGITGTDWFEKFQKQSKGNQKMINQFLVLFSKYAKQQFADPKALQKAMQQPDAQIARLLNQWDKVRFAFADAGFSNDLMQALLHLNNLLDKATDNADRLYQATKDIGAIILLIVGAKYLGKIWKFGRAFYLGIVKNTKKVKAMWRLARIKSGGQAIEKWLMKFFGKGVAKYVASMNIARTLLGFFFKFGAKGLLNFIPIVGNILFLVLTIWDVLQLILDLFFPKAGSWLHELGSEIWDFIIHPIISIQSWWEKWFGWIGKGKGNKIDTSNTFPGVTPDKNSFDYMYKQATLPPSLGGQGILNNNNFQPKISYKTDINVSNTSPEQLKNMLNDAYAKNNQDLIKKYQMAIANSLNYN